MEVYGFVPLGYEGELVRVEVDLRPGIPGMDIVGLPTGAVREARERIRIAWRRSGLSFPQQRILINLSPADLPKSGSGFDLPMALALLAASSSLPSTVPALLAVGELALDGQLRGVPGVLSALARAREKGLLVAALPSVCRAEAEAVEGFHIVSAPSFAPLVEELKQQQASTTQGVTALPGYSPLPGLWPGWTPRPSVFRALLTAAVGGHSCLLYGPPGGGKTVAGRYLQKLLPPLEPQEAWEVARLKSLRGEINTVYPQPPFRSPHHAANVAGLVGGGKANEPGEAALAHRGVLFLDEALQFSPSFLQTLREPLEEGQVSLARAGRQLVYPARFQLVLTANACPCGQAGRREGVCLCGHVAIRKYWDRLGGALMDRVDIRLFLEAGEEYPPEGKVNLSHERQRLENALERRRARLGQEKNAWRDWGELQKSVILTSRQQTFWREGVRREAWSGRGAVALLRLAVTLADLDNRPSLKDEDLEEALCLRKAQGEEYWQT